MDLREFKERLFALGSAAGLGDMEIYAARTKELEVRIFKSEVDDYSLSDVVGVGFRAQYGGKVGYAFTERMDEASLQFLVEAAKANAQIIDSDDEIEFFPGSPAYPEVETYNAALDDLSSEEYIDAALRLEQSVGR